jgi:osmotically-inducible protein OsmY
MRFLLALVVIGIAVYFITNRAPSPLARRSGEFAAAPATASRDTAARPNSGVTANDVRAGVANAGTTLQEKARVAGERIDDARVITVIKGKFALDKDLSAGAISVSCQDGRVVLDGTVPSEELAQRAVQQAQATSGVVDVTSHLTVGATPAR